MSRISLGLVGFGHWGRILARVSAGHPDIELTAIADTGEQGRADAAAAHPRAKILSDVQTAIDDPSVGALILTSPAATHFPLAMAAIAKGKDVLITKPVTVTAEDARTLAATAERLGRIVLVDHTFLYHPCVDQIAAALRQNWLGSPLTYDVVRTGLGIYKEDVDIIADLSVHDFAILDRWFGLPSAVSATTQASIAGCPADNVSMSLNYSSGMVAHVRSSWLSPLKQRLAILVGSRQMIVWDDARSEDRLLAFDAGVERLSRPEKSGRAALGYRSNGSRPLPTAATEPLKAEIDDFVACIGTRRPPLSTLAAAARVMTVVEAARESSRHGGAPAMIAPL